MSGFCRRRRMVALERRATHLLVGMLTLVWAASACALRKGDVAPSQPVDTVKIQVAQDGLYALEKEALVAAGLAIDSWQVAFLALSQNGVAVPYFLEGDFLIFYGNGSDDRYSSTRPYLLESGREGLAMVESTVSPSESQGSHVVRKSRRLEENKLYIAETSSESPEDPWFWQRLGQGQKVSVSFDLASPADGEATIRIGMWGATHHPDIEQDHDFDLYVNKRMVGTVRWEGQTRTSAELKIPTGILTAGANELWLDNEAQGAAPLDIMDLDWIELDYPAKAEAIDDRLQFTGSGQTQRLGGFSERPIVLDVTDEAAPRLLVGWQYTDGVVQVDANQGSSLLAAGPKAYATPLSILPLVTGKLPDTSNQADLIVLTSEALAPALAPLIEARSAQGVEAIVAPMEEIADSFGYGSATPDAIVRFLTFALESWREPRPRYLLIVGDATTDYLDHLGFTPENLIPSPMVPVVYGGETVSDARLADVDGDWRADLAVGRWPVSTVAEVASLVERTLAYESTPAANRALFTADGSEPRFASMAKRLAPAAGIRNEDLHLLVGSDAPAVAAAWNEGSWLATYIGHGSVQRWGKDEVFTPEAVDRLEATALPIVLQLTCLTGLFAHPELPSLSETLLLHENGPVLIVAATSLTLSTHQEPFAQAMLEQLVTAANLRIGDAFQRAKNLLDIEDNDGLREINDTFVLLGDPSALIIRPSS
jgi:hypothetical protein